MVRGGWMLDAAESVCQEPNALALLASLLETVRQYARECSEEQGELDDCCRCHAAYFEGLVEQAKMNGPQQAYWYSRLDTDYDNINASLDWLLQDNGGTYFSRRADYRQKNHLSLALA